MKSAYYNIWQVFFFSYIALVYACNSQADFLKKQK